MKIPLTKLLSYNNADKALQEHQSYARRTKRKRKTQVASDSESDDELTRPDPQFDIRNKRRRTLHILSQKARNTRHISTRSGRPISLTNGYREDESDLTDSSSHQGARRPSRATKQSSLRYHFSDFEDDFEESDAISRTSRTSVRLPQPKRAVDFYPLSEFDDEFAKRHQYFCMFSNDLTVIDEDGERDYVMCQGCSFMFHVECLGPRFVEKARHKTIGLKERMGKRLCVLQCGKCAGIGKNGKITTRCVHCGQTGERCEEFKYPEQSAATKEREENEMEEDEDLEVPGVSQRFLQGWNDASKVLFRCMDCERAWHYDHLSPLEKDSKETTENSEPNDTTVPQANRESMDIDETATNPHSHDKHDDCAKPNGIKDPLSQNEILKSYTSGLWRCAECQRYHNNKVEVVLGWRPSQNTSTLPDDIPDSFKREYLVKFEDESYHRALWVPGSWLSGVSFQMKSNFDSKEIPSIQTSTDAIPEAWLRVDLIFDVEYEGGLSRNDKKFRSHSEELKALPKVTRALCKWQQLKYEDSTYLSGYI
jgi:chromodomain-helicase-DNA-binding protein 4